MFHQQLYGFASERIGKLSFDDKNKLFLNDVIDTCRPSNFKVDDIV